LEKPINVADPATGHNAKLGEVCSDRTAAFAGLMTSPDGAPIIALPIGYHGPLDEGERTLHQVQELLVGVVERDRRAIPARADLGAGYSHRATSLAW
jgi:hypothetical protein